MNLPKGLDSTAGCSQMSKMKMREGTIIALAYFHRYGWIATMMVCIAIWPMQLAYILSIGSIVFSIWSFIGYKCKWKHIYCSFQDAYRKKMTPNSVRWHQIKKSDAYGVPLIFLILGLVLLIAIILG